MKNVGKIRKRVLQAISIFLVVATIIPNISNIISHAIDKPTYVSEVKMAYAKDTSDVSTEEAKKSLRIGGYIVVENDLNNGTGRVASFIGYKTTTDEKEAITDLKVMDMDGGYKLNNYAATLEYYSSSIREKSDGMMLAAKDLKSNYEKGSPAAKLAMQALNYMIVKEKANQPLGEYLINTTRTSDDFYNIVLKCDPDILIFIVSQLTLGVAEYKTKTWIERYVEVASGKYNTDGLHTRAMKIYPRFREFEERYNTALVAFNNDKNKGTSTVTPVMMRTLSAYETLNEYTVGKLNVGDIFSELLDATELYPLVLALSPAQLSMLESTDVESFVTSLVNNTEAGEKAFAETSEQLEKESAALVGADLWTNIREEVYEDKEIAMTDQAVRQATAKNNLDAIIKIDSTNKRLSDGLSLCASVAFVGFGMAQLSWVAIASIIGATAKFTFATIGTTIATSFSLGVGASIAAGIFSGGVIILIAAVIVVILLCFHFLAKAIKDAIAYNNPTFSKIPPSMYEYFEDIPDNKNPGSTVSRYIGYEAVNDLSGNPADLNAWNGLKWNALYTTKDPDAGSPITTDLIVKHADGVVPVGYSALSKFGEVTAYNVNTHMRKDKVNGIYFFFKKKDGNKEVVKGEYLSDIIVKEGSSEAEVMNYFTVNNYTPVKTNLLVGSGTIANKRVAYLGYKTTNTPESAIADIRVAPNCNTEQIFIGESSYTNAGTYVGMTLFYAKNTATTTAGDPILADFFVTERLSNAPPSADFVPLSLISGGPAVNLSYPIKPGFTSLFNETYVTANLPQVYIYYRSSVTYDKGPDYVSGFAFFQSTQNYKNRTGELLSESGYTYIGQDVTNDGRYSNKMAYSTTKNKYRALKKVFTLYSEEDNAGMQLFTLRDGIGYIAVPRMDIVNTDIHMGDRYAWMENVEINPCNTIVQYYQSTGMYVTSGTSQGEYFTIDDIYFRTQLESPKQGYYGVADWYDKTFSPANIKAGCWQTNKIFMYIGGQIPINPKYIRGIVAGNSPHGEPISKLDLFHQNATEVVTKNSDGGYYKNGAETPWIYTSLGFTRTNDPNYAVSDIKIVAYDIYKKPERLPGQITVNEIDYKLASEKPFAFEGKYTALFIYQTEDPAAGTPITDVQWLTDTRFLPNYDTMEYLDNSSIVPGCKTITELADSGEYSEILYAKRDSIPQQKYIQSVGNVADSSSNDAIKKLAISGFSHVIKISNTDAFDANDSNGGDYVYTGFNKTHNKDDAITGLMASDRMNTPNPALTVTSHGGAYKYALPKHTADFNSDSTNAANVFLYYSKDPGIGSPITEIMFSYNEYEPDWYTVDNGWNGTSNYHRINFNKGDYSCDEPSAIYMHYKRGSGVVSERPSSKFASVFLSMNPITTAGLFTLLLVTGGGFIVYQQLKKRKAQDEDV